MRAARGHRKAVAGVVANRNQRTLCDRFGDAQQLTGLAFTRKMQCGPTRPESARAKRELETPHTRKHRSPPARLVTRCSAFHPVESKGNHHRRDFAHPFREIPSRAGDPLAPIIGLYCLAGLEIRNRVLEVELADLGLRLGVLDDQPLVSFEVAAHRGTARDVDAVEQHLTRHLSVEVEPFPDLLRGRQELVGLRKVELGHLGPFMIPAQRRSGLCRFVGQGSSDDGGVHHGSTRRTQPR